MNAPIPEPRAQETHAIEDALQVSLMEEPLQGEQSGMPVLELLAALRKYHQLRDFSHLERFGTPDNQSRQTLSELGKVQQSLQEITSRVGAGEEDFVIEASLEFRVAQAG